VSKIYLICGFIGSGKTTFSKQLADQKHAFRFSIDEWMLPLYGEHMEREIFDARLHTLQGLFKTSAKQLLKLDVPVIFDFGFWYKKERDEYKAWANENGFECEIVYLDVSYEECCRRATMRNDNLEGKAYEMTPEMLEMFWSWFEIPAASELNLVYSNH
jgi:predicted kinase